MHPRSISHRLLASLVAASVTTAATLMAILMAPAAAAAIPGFTMEVDSTSTDSTSPKSLLVQCPPGTIVIGGGGFISGTGGAEDRILLVAMRPIVTYFGFGYQIIAAEDEIGTDEGWVLATRALCAPPPPGLEYVWEHAASSSAPSRTVTAACPDGKNVLGTGGMISGPTGQIALRSIVPTPDPPTAVSVAAHEDATGTNGTWSLTSWAICADPLPGLQLVTETATGSSSALEAVTCPAGTYVYGVGAQVGGDPTHVRLHAADPHYFGFSDYPNAAGALAGDDGTVTDQRWRLTAIGVCAY